MGLPVCPPHFLSCATLLFPCRPRVQDGQRLVHHQLLQCHLGHQEGFDQPWKVAISPLGDGHCVLVLMTNICQ